MFEIVFNKISASEISQLSTEAQLDLLEEFKVSPEDIENVDGKHFGKIERGGKSLYRYRAKDMRIYFQIEEEKVVIHRVLHKNTLQDFFFRSNMPVSEDEALSESKVFWELIEEGEKAQRL